MSLIFLLANQPTPINTTEINNEIIYLGCLLFAIFFIILLFITVAFYLKYSKKSKELEDLKKKQKTTSVNALSKEESNIITLYSNLKDSDKQAIVSMLKSLNSKD